MKQGKLTVLSSIPGALGKVCKRGHILTIYNTRMEPYKEGSRIVCEECEKIRNYRKRLKAGTPIDIRLDYLFDLDLVPMEWYRIIKRFPFDLTRAKPVYPRRYKNG